MGIEIITGSHSLFSDDINQPRVVVRVSSAAWDDTFPLALIAVISNRHSKSPASSRAVIISDLLIFWFLHWLHMSLDASLPLPCNIPHMKLINWMIRVSKTYEDYLPLKSKWQMYSAKLGLKCGARKMWSKICIMYKECFRNKDNFSACLFYMNKITLNFMWSCASWLWLRCLRSVLPEWFFRKPKEREGKKQWRTE